MVQCRQARQQFERRMTNALNISDPSRAERPPSSQGTVDLLHF